METVCPVMINVNTHVMARQSCVLIAASEDIVAFPFAFAAHVLTPPILNADVYGQKIVTYVGTRVYPPVRCHCTTKENESLDVNLTRSQHVSAKRSQRVCVCLRRACKPPVEGG